VKTQTSFGVRQERWGGGERERVMYEKAGFKGARLILRIYPHLPILSVSPLLHSMSDILS